MTRYADLLEDEAYTSGEEEGLLKPQSGLVKSHDGWRKEMRKWVQEERARSDADSDGEELGSAMYGRQRSKWLPRSLELLFGGQKEVDVDEQLRRVRRREAYTEEARLMELVRGTPYASDDRPSSASASDSRLPSAPATSSLFRNVFGRMTSYATRSRPASAPDRMMSRDVA